MDIHWPLCDGRLTVRPATEADAAAFLDYKRLPESQTYISRTVDTIEESLALIRDRASEPASLLCALVVGDEVVGDIGGRRYRPETLGPEPDAWDFYLGYAVHPRLWGRGLASAAVRQMVAALHHQGGVRRVVAKAFGDNAASIRVLTKNGFRLEGTERAAVLGRDGQWLDDCTLAHLLQTSSTRSARFARSEPSGIRPT